MRKYLVLLLLAASTIIVSAQKNPGKPYLIKTLAGQSIREVTAQTSGGNILVSAGDAGENRIEVYIEPNNKRRALSKEEIQKQIEEEYTFDISVANTKLSAIARLKRGNIDWKKSLAISFRIYVPQNVSTDLTTSGGNIQLSNISGDQRFKTSGGNLQVSNVGGKIKGRTSGGNIHLINSRDEIDIETSGGNIEAEESTGNIKLSTSGGTVKLTSLSGSIKATTSGGNVEAEGIKGELVASTSGGNVELNRLSCSLVASTSGGHIDAAFEEPGKYIKINNSGGDIDLRLPKGKGFDFDLSASKIKTTDFTDFSGSIDKNDIKGKLNGGGIAVTINANSGQLNLSFQ